MRKIKDQTKGRRRRTSPDARPGKNVPGRNAFFAGMNRVRGLVRSLEAVLGRTAVCSKEPLNAGKRRNSLTVQEQGPVLRKNSCELHVPSCKHKNRCALKRKNPLVADENHVVRQRSTAKKTGSSFRRYASRLFVLGTGSLIKSGIQQMVIPKRLDSVMLNMRPVLDVSVHTPRRR